MTSVAASTVAIPEAAAASCAHCALPVPASHFVSGNEEQFCCNGCRAARQAILACGFENYYALRDQPRPASSREDPAALFDDPVFLEKHAQALEGGAMRINLCLDGVHCAACLWLLERLPSVVDGLLTLELDLGRSVAQITWDPARVSLSNIATELSRFGYPAHPVEPSARRAARKRTERRSLAEIGVAAACMGNVMLLAFALYSGEIEPPFDTLFRALSAIIGLISVAWPGRVFFRGALAAFRARTWHLDTPIALALGVGTLVGVLNVIRGTGEIYFDSITMLVLLLLIGRWLQARQQHRASEAVELLYSLTPRTVRLVDESEPGSPVSEVSADVIQPGQLIEVLPDRCVPVDGIIEDGESIFDESILSGESVPMTRAIGDEVAAGASNLRRTVRVRVNTSGRETRLGKLMSTIETLSRSRVPLIGSADRLAKPFVLITLSLAALCVGIHWLSSPVQAIEHTVALLIVVCPCAIAIATPLATSVAIGRLASRGILVKGGDVIEALAETPRAILDKTGTLTDGRFEVRRWATLDGVDRDTIQALVSSLESTSSHPIAAALTRPDLANTETTDVMSYPGLGLSGRASGQSVLVGSARLLEKFSVPLSPDLTGGDDGFVKVHVAMGNKHVATIDLGDDLRADSEMALETLRGFGWQTEMVSGDLESRVTHIAERLGIKDHRAQATPEDKLDRVNQLMEHGDRVVMIGDGVNDAAALAAAHVGIAVHGGAEVSLAAADVYLNREGMAPVLELVESARSTTRRVRACLVVGLSYNAVAAGIALAGLLNPIFAAVLMPASSLSVLAIALAGRTHSGRNSR